MSRQEITSKLIWGSAAFVATGLLSLNAFFAKDFIDKVEVSIKDLTSKAENTSDKVSEVYVRLAIIETKMADLKSSIERQTRLMPKKEDASYGTNKKDGEQFRIERVNQACRR